MADLLLLLVVVSVLVLLNGLFVAAEFAVVASRPTRLRQMADEGNRGAGAVLRVVRDARSQDIYFATAQLGITLASLGLGMYGEHELVQYIEPLLHGLGAWAEPVSHALAAALAVGLLTFVHVVIGEMVPKGMALTHPEQTMVRLAGIMRVAHLVFLPLVWLLDGAGNVVLRLLRIPAPSSHELMLSPEELEMVIEESTERGLLAHREGQILKDIMDFSDRMVHEVMTPRTRMEAFPVTLDEATLAARLSTSGHTRFPVYDTDIDHIVGILHLKDFIRWQLAAERPFDLPGLLRPVRQVPELMLVEELLEIFRRERRHLAIVFDEYGGTAGLVSLEDLIEEVVGEVRDEFDVEAAPVEQLSDGALSVRGDVLVDDLGELVDLPDGHPDAATVGGLVLTLLGRPAERGDVVHLGPVTLTVEDMDGRAVGRVRVEEAAD